jgi:hypothetical protein
METGAREKVTDWTVDYGDGPRPCAIPHAWRQDVDVRWEGPATYRTTLREPGFEMAPFSSKSRGQDALGTPRAGRLRYLLFEGVSYRARVFLNGELRAEHEGIWDAFAVSLEGFEGQEVEVKVEVLKNGGPTFPVPEVASGFLPYVYHTFGGIWRDVWLCEGPPDLEPPAPPCRVAVQGTKIEVDGKPFYLRGVLTWGWYPELGHPSPDDEEILREVGLMKQMGFNTCKFCLWVPPHRYLETLAEEGMFAWMELPLWLPTADPQKQEQMFEELMRIVLQYRRHSNIVAWTCGCELSETTSAEFRKRLYEMVKELTGAALVKDNSGSSEMYGGDLREYGDFYDFHPYCDLPFYPVVLDSLLIGPREKKPILLGEFNDVDVHRDLARIKREAPYWASKDPALNDPGVRWQMDLPRVLEESRWPLRPQENQSSGLEQDSWYKACFQRKSVQEAIRAREDIGGYVLTGWRDTPISSAGFLDDWGQSREDGAVACWNGTGMLFPVPFRRPPWVHGGNRAGFVDPYCHFAGPLRLVIGFHAAQEQSGALEWVLDRVERKFVRVASGRCDPTKSTACTPIVVGWVESERLEPGMYRLGCRFAKTEASWLMEVFAPFQAGDFPGWRKEDEDGLLFDLPLGSGPNLVATGCGKTVGEALAAKGRVIWLLTGRATWPMPFWREAAYKFGGELRTSWEQLASISGDRAIALPALEEIVGKLDDLQVGMLRVDTRTYAEHPIQLKAKVGGGVLVATTLRPFGGLGAQPYGVRNNPAGASLLKRLIRWAER